MNHHRRASDWAAQSGGGRNSAPVADFFAFAVGYAKCFVSNNHEFRFLGAAEKQNILESAKEAGVTFVSFWHEWLFPEVSWAA